MRMMIALRRKAYDEGLDHCDFLIANAKRRRDRKARRLALAMRCGALLELGRVDEARRQLDVLEAIHTTDAWLEETKRQLRARLQK
jgi:hypothetical protein